MFLEEFRKRNKKGSPSEEGAPAKRVRGCNINKNYNPDLLSNAKELRKNMTKEERKLWFEFLRFLPVHICRQKVIDKFILDFYCPSKKNSD